MNGITHHNSLQPGYRLHWYEIKSILGVGGFGITYLATDQNLHRDVAIKEYFPTDLSVRGDNSRVHPATEDFEELYKWGLDRFITEARTLAKFKHPNIVPVQAVFEENDTGYMIMTYEHGQSLQDKLAGKKTMSEAELKAILMPILDGLEKVHQAGFIHRDLKPGNIFIRADGSPVLLDFGSARQALGEESKTLTAMVSPNYTPYEQYHSKSDEQGPWTDIFALGATLYRGIAGITPISAMDRSRAILEGQRDPYVPILEIGVDHYSVAFLMAIDHALAFKRIDRPQSINDWRYEFELTNTVQTINLYRGPQVTKSTARGEIIKMEISPADRITRPLEKTTVTEKRDAGPRPGTRPGTRPVIKIVLLLSLLATGYFLYMNPAIVAGYASVDLSQTLKRVTTQLGEYAEWVEQEVRRRMQGGQAPAPAARDQEIPRLLQGAEEDFRLGRLVEPEAANALRKYSDVLLLDANNQDAMNGRQRIFSHFLDTAAVAINRQAFDEADASFNQAEQIEPGTEQVRIGRLRLLDERTGQERINLEQDKKRFEQQQQLEQQRKQEEEQKQLQLTQEKQRREKKQRRQEQDRQKQLALERESLEQESRRLEQERLKQEVYEQELEAQRREDVLRLEEEASRQQALENTAEYNRLLPEARQALYENNLDLAALTFEQLLEFVPESEEALAGLSRVQLLKEQCQHIVGRWSWFNGGLTTFNNDGTVTAEHAVLPGNQGTWECTEPAARKFVVRWKQGGWVNRLTLSGDDLSLEGVNQEGARISGTRRE